MKSTRPKRPTGMISTTSTSNISLHSNYLGFAIQAAAVKPYAERPFGVPVSRSIIDAIRYSFDFIDASAEYAYQLLKSSPDGDPRPDNWLKRYIDREWKNLAISDKLGFLSFFHRGEGFWMSDDERILFEDLKHVRNALTHPGLFGKTTEAEFPDYHAPAAWSETTVRGKMRREAKSLAGFSEHPEDLGVEDAKKAVEIALRHAERFEQLLGAKNIVLFGAINPRTGEKRPASKILARMKKRHFDALWGAK